MRNHNVYSLSKITYLSVLILRESEYLLNRDCVSRSVGLLKYITDRRTNIGIRNVNLNVLRLIIDSSVVGGVVAVDRSCVPAVNRVCISSRSNTTVVPGTSESLVVGAAVGHCAARYSRSGYSHSKR